ncbi:MAG TPA: serine protease, partial [Candidatus Saccharimonadia bacterium]|nr:serine protease [Candidatus Saccharimonadia bacterium]
MFRKTALPRVLGLITLCLVAPLAAQQVCLPAPHLLTTMPMGGQAGTSVEVTITGENLEDVTALTFSNPKIIAKPVLDADGKPVESKFLVAIAPDAPAGVYDARVTSRLGISSARAFSVSTVQELTRTKPNNSLEAAMALPTNVICNATMTAKAVDYYSFQAVKGKRVAVDCAAVGIDSKLRPVVIIADAQGRDLLVNRTGGVLDFTPTEDGNCIIKVHALTFKGGADHFYRLALVDVPGNGPAPRQPATLTVSSMSWPPQGLSQ